PGFPVTPALPSRTYPAAPRRVVIAAARSVSPPTLPGKMTSGTSGQRSDSTARQTGTPGRIAPRSEERRVGKEWRARWQRDQAEDGIRDLTVTGVQTCALPISRVSRDTCIAVADLSRGAAEGGHRGGEIGVATDIAGEDDERHLRPAVGFHRAPDGDAGEDRAEIGRASCRERVESAVAAGSSRRRHTRFDCDWSSDVCSSDLPGFP